MTKAALVAFTKALAEELGPRGIRVNAVAPGPIWTPLIPATGWPDKLPKFGQDTPLGRAGQPAELAGAYVYLASDDASYMSGAILPVTGGQAALTAARRPQEGAGHAGESTRESSLKDPELYEELRDDGRRRRRPPGSRTRPRPAVAARSGARAASPATTRTGPSSELSKRAKELGLSGYSSKRKGELISALRNH